MPFVAVHQQRVRSLSGEKQVKLRVLTADVDRALEGLGDLWVELNHQVAIFSYRVVALLDALRNPRLKRLLHDGVDDIHDELPGQAVNIALVRKEVHGAVVSPALFEDGLDVKALVERHVQYPNIGRLDVCTWVNG